MVFFFTTTDKHLVYMGKDKYENEELLKYGFPEDVWFHVSDHSSAHVYLRLHESETFDNFPESAKNECLQLVKENSIEGYLQLIKGSKCQSVKIVYTPFSNLKKTATMDVGQVGYHNTKLELFAHNVSKDRILFKKIQRTQREEYPNLKDIYDNRIEKEKMDRKNEYKKQQIQDQIDQKLKKEEKELKQYKTMMDPKKMVKNSNQNEAEDDFM